MSEDLKMLGKALGGGRGSSRKANAPEDNLRRLAGRVALVFAPSVDSEDYIRVYRNDPRQRSQTEFVYGIYHRYPKTSAN